MCLSVRDHIFGTTRPIFAKFLCMLAMAVARRSVYKLRISGFVDDAIVAHCCRSGRTIRKGSPHSITERRVQQLISVLGSQPAGDVSHKPGGRLPLLSTRPAVTIVNVISSSPVQLQFPKMYTQISVGICRRPSSLWLWPQLQTISMVFIHSFSFLLVACLLSNSI